MKPISMPKLSSKSFAIGPTEPGVREVVDHGDLEVAVACDVRAKEVPADPAEAVDPDSGLRHRPRPPRCCFRTESSKGQTAGGPGSSEDDPPGPSPARDLTADGV